MYSRDRRERGSSLTIGRFLTTSAAVHLLLAGPGVGAAQAADAIGQATPPNPPEEELKEVVVTANRRSQSVKDVPYAISAVSGEDLQRLGITDAGGLSHMVPGVTFLDKGAYAGLLNNSIIIHGLNVEPVGKLQPNFSQSAVATYIDDAPVFVNLHLTDLERVEVLRGPQGTLYGSGSLGGTVRYLQNDPDPSKYQVIATAGVGSTHNSNSPNYDGDLIVNVPITPTFAIRAEAGDTHQAGFINLPNAYALDANSTPVLAQPGNVLSSPPVYAPVKSFNDFSIQNYRVAALWQATDNLSIRLNFNKQDTKAGGPPEITPSIYGNTLNDAAFSREPITDSINLYSADITYDLGFATLTSSTSAYNHRVWSDSDATRNELSFPFYAPYYGSSPRPYFDAIDTLNEKGTTEEVRLASRASTSLDYVVGLYYSDQHSTPAEVFFDRGYYDYYAACQPVYGFGSNQCGVGELYGIVATENNVPVVKDLSYIQVEQNHFKDRAVYGQLTWHILPRLEVTGGVRVFSQVLETNEIAGLPFVGPVDVVSRTSSTTNSSALGKADISYKISPTLTTYFNWSQGFRRGANNALPPFTNFGKLVVTPAGALSAKPDRVDNFEVGLKGSWRELMFDASVYDIQWHDTQAVIVATAIGIPSLLNVGQGYSRGVDLAISSYITNHIFGQVNYSLNESKLVTVSPIVSEVSFSPFLAGGRFPGVPENQLNWRFEYRQDTSNGWKATYGLHGSYESGSFSTISANSARAPGFTMWNPYLLVAHGNTSARLFVNNVGDTLGITARADTRKGRFPDAPYYISTPRTFGLSVTHSFSTPR